MAILILIYHLATSVDVERAFSKGRLILSSDCQGYKLPARVPGQGTTGKGQGHNIPTLIKPVPPNAGNGGLA